ncbi:acetyl/propionyl/methylcrotonyl-CoA carboxylase subunit alpha [Pseudomonas sp. MWU13-2105]|uniref:acetyl/propionyl/methylcrotonyl-CoA carboxylase subunit alpha n=1 Tax=Pseudomonas sp. MWU13-2105 TaxID=2935074 RepID=UPI00200C9D88|nr:acetyl/propionyl/methylcrotonyl-CoA carboxylase subunit alpha [Pseudomonas sp. MWU13-2105]
MPAFHKILIANRGEIACRVILGAQALGYRTVAVFSEADAQARHVQLADEAICIGPAQVSQSYLNSAALLDAARKTAADALHPGYGLLSENAAFAQACLDAGLTFIGPSPAAIALMGSKRLSKIAMLAAGVPCIAGYQGAEQDDASLARAAEQIGYPLMIKASAGGGGRGLRLVHGAEELVQQIHCARSEALSAFGSDELILEQALIEPRHVEIQLFGDQHGQLIHLGERDCSIQRRHQKVIEEAPCPVMTAELRQAMGEAALKAARAVHYVGAGTVEFLLDDRGQFYFLEMNTRLQVEHPVSEMITGLDLLAWQINVAAGLPLPLRQEQVEFNGHAIEVRLYAEDPSRDFLPQSGWIRGWEPAPGAGVRIDHGLLEGDTISPFYDPLLGKLIAHGATREEARRKLLRAVEDCVLLGIASNQRLLTQLLGHPRFVAGQFNTAFIDEHFSAHPGLQAYVPSTTELALAAALFYRQAADRHTPGLSGWRNTASVPRAYRLALEDTRFDLLLTDRPGEALRVQRADEHVELRVLERDARWLRVQVDGVVRRYAYRLDGDQLWLFTNPGSLHLRDCTHAPVQPPSVVGSGTLQAPMDGAIVQVLVSAGSSVRKGQLLLVLEAMKMEHPLKAGMDGVVRQVRVIQGDQVKNRQILLEVE